MATGYEKREGQPKGSFGHWLAGKLAESGASHGDLAREYMRVVADDPTMEGDGRSKNGKGRPATHKVGDMIYDGVTYGPAVTWRYGVAVARLGVSSSGLEALLAAGHRAEAIATIGLQLRRYWADGVDETDPMSGEIKLYQALLDAAASLVALPTVLPSAESLAKLAEYSDALSATWRRWLRSGKRETALGRFERAAYVLLDDAEGDVHCVRAAREVLREGSSSVVSEFWRARADHDVAQFLAREGHSDALESVYAALEPSPSKTPDVQCAVVLAAVDNLLCIEDDGKAKSLARKVLSAARGGNRQLEAACAILSGECDAQALSLAESILTTGS